jgi:alanine racemase
MLKTIAEIASQKHLMESKGLRPTWAEIDLDALESNLQLIKKHVAAVNIFPVVKADAYGHGAREICSQMESLHLPYICVALLEEAIELRQSGYTRPILIIGALEPYQIAEALRFHFTVTVHRMDIIDEIEKESARLERRIPFHIKIDTGMARLGFLPEQCQNLVDKLKGLKFSYPEGAFSNFSSADDPQRESTQRQMKVFHNVLLTLKQHHVYPKINHLANSAAILNFPQSWLDAVRPGLLIYGINPPDAPNQLPVKPVFSLKSQVISLKNFPKDTPIGYGERFITTRKSRVAILPIGYDDGILRSLYPGGTVLVRGKRAPIIGAISMDLTAIDVTQIQGTKVGETVILVGQDEPQHITLSEIASKANTIPYEILCGIGRRVPKMYLKNQKILHVNSTILPDRDDMIFFKVD